MWYQNPSRVMLLRLQRMASLPPYFSPLFLSRAPPQSIGSSLSQVPGIPGASSRLRPYFPQRSPPSPDLGEFQTCLRLIPPLFCAKDWPRSVASPALGQLRRRFRPGAFHPPRGSPRLDPVPPDDEILAAWLRFFTAEILNPAVRLRTCPDFRAFSTQQPRHFAGNSQLEAAAHLLLIIVRLGFDGLRCKLAPDLVKKTQSDPWVFLTPAIWMWCTLVPALIGLSPIDPSITSLWQTPEWLWYKEGFNIAQEDKGMEDTELDVQGEE